MQCTYNVTSWRVRVINYCCRRKATLRSFCIVSAHIAVIDDFMAISCRRKRCLHAKFLMFLSYCNQIWIFATNFHRSPQYQLSRKSIQRETRRYMRTDRRTDMTEVIGAFGEYANTPKKRSRYSKKRLFYHHCDSRIYEVNMVDM